MASLYRRCNHTVPLTAALLLSLSLTVWFSVRRNESEPSPYADGYSSEQAEWLLERYAEAFGQCAETRWAELEMYLWLEEDLILQCSKKLESRQGPRVFLGDVYPDDGYGL